ncbi:hypothetical protein AOLI_G00300270 [Acnodon oligacanthus]
MVNGCVYGGFWREIIPGKIRIHRHSATQSTSFCHYEAVVATNSLTVIKQVFTEAKRQSIKSRNAQAAKGSGRVERAESRQSLKNTPNPFRERKAGKKWTSSITASNRETIQLQNHHDNTTRPGRPLLSTPQIRGTTKSGTKALQSHNDLSDL